MYSRTLETVASARPRIERDFDADSVRRLKGTSASDITIGGAELAGQAIAEGLVDECHLLLLGPIVVGGGKRALPAKKPMRLLDTQTLDDGIAFLTYEPVRGS